MKLDRSVSESQAAYQDALLTLRTVYDAYQDSVSGNVAVYGIQSTESGELICWGGMQTEEFTKLSGDWVN